MKSFCGLIPVDKFGLVHCSIKGLEDRYHKLPYCVVNILDIDVRNAIYNLSRASTYPRKNPIYSS